MTCKRCRCARYVLRALGVEEDLAHTSIRIGIGRFTTEAEVDAMVELCARTTPQHGDATAKRQRQQRADGRTDRQRGLNRGGLDRSDERCNGVERTA